MKKLLTAFMAVIATATLADFVPAGTNLVTVPVGLWSNAIPYFAPGGIVTITGANAFGLSVWMDDAAGDPVGGSVRSIANGVLTNTLANFTNSQFIGWTASVGITNVLIQLITSDAPAYLTFDNFYFSASPP